MPVVDLNGETDWEGFRSHARRLLQAGACAQDILWRTSTQPDRDLFGTVQYSLLEPPAAGDAALASAVPQGAQSRQLSQSPGGMPAQAAAPSVPSAMLPVLQRVCLHRDAARFGLMYRYLWRLGREPGLRKDPLDTDVMRLQAMARAVSRDMHKMTAFVRFRPVSREPQPMLHVAWFEPGHYILHAVSGFFMRRFAGMHWAILTPDGSLRWDGNGLTPGPPARRDDAPGADAGEALWLTYYRNTFNPARLKVKMMQKEMPRRYWPNLPEAALIDTLVAQASERSQRMIHAPGTVPARRIPGRAQEAEPATRQGVATPAQ